MFSLKVEADFALDPSTSPDSSSKHGEFPHGEGDFQPAVTHGNNSMAVSDLFSEVHVSEVRKLETLLEQTELEKSNLQLALETTKRGLEASQAELKAQRDSISDMKNKMMDLTMCENMLVEDGVGLPGVSICITSYF